MNTDERSYLAEARRPRRPDLGDLGVSARAFRCLFSSAAGLLACVALSTVRAEGPSWWTNSDRCVLTSAPGITTNDFAAVNMGQLKWIATNAAAELDALPGGRGSNLAAVLAAWLPDGTNYAVVNVGQLKYIGSLCYDRLIAQGYTNAYPWSAGTNDFAVANVGQVKFVFGFDLTKDSDGDGLADWVETGTGIFVSPWNTGTSSSTNDTDHDGILDGAEVAARTDPCSDDTTGPLITITTPTNNTQYLWIP